MRTVVVTAWLGLVAALLLLLWLPDAAAPTPVATEELGEVGGSERRQLKQRPSFDAKVGRTPAFVLKDMRVADNLVPVHRSEPAILFWRPQKVGSSTILSLLVSYGYRFNVLVRRKSAFNALCVKAARCALQNFDSVVHTMEAEHVPVTSHKLRTHLTKYVYERLHGAGGPSGLRRVAQMNEERAERQLYRISTSHQMCNLPPLLVKTQLECMFTNHTQLALSSLKERGTEVNTFVPFSRNGTGPFEVRELYVLREPMARAVSVYYFWGELFKLHRVDKQPEEHINATRRERRRMREPGFRGVNAATDLYQPLLKPRRQLRGASGGGLDEGNGEGEGWGESLAEKTEVEAEQGDVEESEEAEEEDYEYEYSLMTGVAAETTEPAEPGAAAERELGAAGVGKHEQAPQLLLQRGQRRLEAASALPKKPGGGKDGAEVQKWRLGNAKTSTEVVKGTIFTYHGDETTVPPREIAMAYAKRLPYVAGMPGPSYTWSAFAGSAELAIAEMKTDRIMTIVTERLDESLLVASHYLGWSLADVVVTAPRKALSSHPKHTDWPAEAVDAMQTFLDRNGEMAVYEAAKAKLDDRIASLTQGGLDFPAELTKFRALRSRVRKVCLTDEYLERYRKMIHDQGYQQHQSNNKLRDTADEYVDKGHCFSFNSDILFSYDICGPCEAHAILFAVSTGLATTIDAAPLLKDLDPALIKDNPNFAKCPKQTRTTT